MPRSAYLPLAYWIAFNSCAAYALMTFGTKARPLPARTHPMHHSAHAFGTFGETRAPRISVPSSAEPPALICTAVQRPHHPHVQPSHPTVLWHPTIHTFYIWPSEPARAQHAAAPSYVLAYTALQPFTSAVFSLLLILGGINDASWLTTKLAEPGRNALGGIGILLGAAASNIFDYGERLLSNILQ